MLKQRIPTLCRKEKKILGSKETEMEKQWWRAVGWSTVAGQSLPVYGGVWKVLGRGMEKRRVRGGRWYKIFGVWGGERRLGLRLILDLRRLRGVWDLGFGFMERRLSGKSGEILGWFGGGPPAVAIFGRRRWAAEGGWMVSKKRGESGKREEEERDKAKMGAKFGFLRL
ncbi:hypothetical protein A4A49_30910 [Nicotiana attenuata]|uniref:Uncharacterized protein n=1 Tax=Nicotiana attenuata TaxID=49451 RepID=A0A314KMQ3_NICAT|nr:hypothetical protein A4A49_30910 [Nicotiana attenuata]